MAKITTLQEPPLLKMQKMPLEHLSKRSEACYKDPTSEFGKHRLSNHSNVSNRVHSSFSTHLRPFSRRISCTIPNGILFHIQQAFSVTIPVVNTSIDRRPTWRYERIEYRNEFTSFTSIRASLDLHDASNGDLIIDTLCDAIISCVDTSRYVMHTARYLQLIIRREGSTSSPFRVTDPVGAKMKPASQLTSGDSPSGSRSRYL